MVTSAEQCPQNEICLTSFRHCENHHDEGCSTPPGAYTLLTSDRTVQAPALIDGTNYTLSWKLGPHKDAPVRIQWKIVDVGVVWETNTTESEYLFNPGKILASFPTPQALGMTSESAWFRASHNPTNELVFSQPEAGDSRGNYPQAFSQQFTVQPVFVETYLQTQAEISRNTEYNKWKLAVGIGVGLGVPLLLAVTAFGVFKVVKEKSRKQMNKDIGTSR
ncbi:hypothetical protein HD806DRAFT_526401 [Xylariaceae sp. AK1471]|nr:hypothetical protein HD806DRAFT_526401 [Xylariaceae sp. AK1471]